MRESRLLFRGKHLICINFILRIQNRERRLNKTISFFYERIHLWILIDMLV